MVKLKIFIVLFTISFFMGDILHAQLPGANGRRLRDIIADKYPEGNLLIGGTTGSWALYSNTGKLMNREFSYVTPENDFKQAQVHPDNGGFQWSKADPWVNHVVTNNQVLRIHGPVSPQCSNWAKTDSRTPEELEENMRDFMKFLCMRYNGKTNFEYLDVINETVINGEWHKNKAGTDWEVPWFIIGQDTDENQTPLYIKYAFEIANQYAPDLKLVINQHEKTIVNSSWNKIKNMVTYLRNQGLRVDAIGWQAHISAGWEKTEGQQQALRDLIDWAHQNNLEFLITEQSVYLTENTPTALKEQADTYKAIMDILVEKSKNGKILWNTWHIDDATGWRTDEFPAMFDSEYRAKPAYYAVQLALETMGDYSTQHNVKINVQNTESADPLENSQVVFNNQTKHTDVNGDVVFQAAAAIYTLEAEKRHYETAAVNGLSVYSDTTFTLTLDSAEVFYNVDFILEDSITGENLESVQIGTENQSELTSLDGTVRFSLNPGLHSVNFEKTNYSDLETAFTINSDTTFTVKLKRSHADVKFRIKNGTQPVNDALVILGNDSLYSNALGICSFYAFPVEMVFSYIIKREYFADITGSVGFDKDTTLNIQMQKTVANIGFEVFSSDGVILNAFAVLESDTAWFDQEMQTKFYNVNKEMFHVYHIFSDNFTVVTDSVYLEKDTTLRVQLFPTSSSDLPRENIFDCYPNPVKNRLTVKAVEPSGIVKILNLNGRAVRSFELNQRKELVDVSDLPDGFYIVQYFTQNGIVSKSKKLIVKK